MSMIFETLDLSQASVISIFILFKLFIFDFFMNND
jgi:hypothetical protein